ncbi:MAG TPA: bifunctional alpha,alpha-trehalose-phosphate synthase (UDP-forming)/trehalose-phosphatase [Spirochaetia bacterium]|nr:bifunctional alpha,alpha-trehalose-phosphate synthase (UDP-forming)/trehalose-phosphatase [Spirochaetia bacterium]
MSKVILVSNRLSVSVGRTTEGDFSFTPSVGGLATGLSSMHGASDSVWVGWSGLASNSLTPAEHATLKGRLLKEFQSITVELSDDELDSFYFGFCNNIIWPLFHYFPTYVEYDNELWESYVRVNRKFAERVLEIAEPGDFIWVHDYQLMLLPDMLKQSLPESTIGFFLHIPFPSFEIFRLLPWRESILDGLLGADLVGFHTYDYARHFLSSVRRLLGLEHSLGDIHRGNRAIKIDAFPMGIDYEKYAGATDRPDVREELDLISKEFIGRKLILSVDRLDYSKGIPQRLRAFHAFLKRYPEYAGRVSMIMVVSPSRTKVPQYMELKRELDELVGIVNGEFGRLDWTPVQYFYRTFDFSHLTALYARADLLLVTPLRDGMNLIAKEYVAAHTDMRAVVVLSETAGAARELGEALIVNPVNIDEIADAIRTGLEQSNEEKAENSTSMHERLKRYDIHFWANDFMDKLRTVAAEQRTLSSRRLTGALRTELSERHRAAENRLVLLGYDGSIIRLSDSPRKAAPDRGLLDLLSRLAADKRNTVVIVSGRSRGLLDQWFGELDIGLVSGHGAWYRTEKKDEWRLIEPIHGEWKVALRPILERYVDRTPGTMIEEKDFSLAWHYRRAEPELASVRVAELKDALLSLTGNFNLSVLEGKKVLEVKNAGINKGRAAALWTSRHRWGFILAVGDDWTDEDMFSILPDDAYSLKVGSDFSNARYYLDSPESVRILLEELVTGGNTRKN